MAQPNLITVIISSSVVATLLSTLLTWFINHRIKKQEFKNEYYKILIKKRVSTYELLEKQISILKFTIMDEDQLSYHDVFSQGLNYFISSTNYVKLATENSLWLNEKTSVKLSKLSHFLNRILFRNPSESELREIGKKEYRNLAILRDELENLTRNDLLRLYDFKQISNKKKVTSFHKLLDNP